MKKYRWNYKKCFKNLGLGIIGLALGVFIGIAPLLAFMAEAWN